MKKINWKYIPLFISLITLMIACPPPVPHAAGYTVTFDKNDALASGSMASQTILQGASANLTPCAFVKAGSSFAGWATDPAGPVEYGDGALYTMGEADVTLYAQWVANGYSVTFDKNDPAASGVMPDQVISSGSTAALSLCAFSKPGWTFSGWATSPGGGVVYADGAGYTMGGADVTLYAKWTANVYQITFEKNDVGAFGVMTPQAIACGSSAALIPNAFGKAGYTFAGWALTPAGGVAYADGASYTMGAGDVTLYAKWNANDYSITFDKNDPAATGTMSPQVIASGSTAALSPCGFSKAGSAFAGWATTPGGAAIYADGASYTMGASNVTLYATWAANSYTVAFDKNDAVATGTMSPQVIASGSTAALTPCGFSKTGWTFTGWAATPGGAVVYADGANYTMGAANVTLYAKWTANVYYITFEKNDAVAVGVMSQQGIACGSTAALIANAFSKPGATFAGWATTPGGAVAYANGANYTMGAGNVTLYAKWTAVNYTVSFDKNDEAATGSMTPQSFASGSTANLKPNAYARFGHTFAGWATTPAGAVVYADGASYTMGSANVTLYAKWSPNIYYVSFDKNDAAATGSMDPQGIAYGTSANLTLCGFSKPGWSFAGWATTPGGAAIYNDGYNYSISASNVTLYAKWLVINHNVTFDKNDPSASGSMGTQTIAEGVAANLNTCAFTKTGWLFAGWATTPSGSVAYGDGASFTMGTANVTLYAKWTANNYTITFNKNDPAASGTMSQQTIACGSTAGLSLNAFTKTGWSFSGWAVSSGGSVVYVDGANYTMGSANVTLYAKWTANNYTITFDKNDPAAVGSMGPQIIASGSTASLSSNAFTKAGWTFSGWATTPSGTVAYANAASYTMEASDVTLYAKWTANNYTITFNKNDSAASGSMAGQIIACGSTVNLALNSFTKAGWSFSGWATTSGGVVEYADGAAYTMGISNVTLYAKWTANVYTITFDKNDPAATGSMTPQTIASGSTANLTPCGFLKTGYSFYQWTTSPSGGYIYEDGASYTMGSANITLYAHWTVTYYTVSFDSQGGSAVSPATTTYGHTISAPSSPSWLGHAFGGWFMEPSCVNRWDFGVDTVTGNMTLYAKWYICTPGLSYVSIKGGTEYGVSKGSADTSGTVIVPEYYGGKLVTTILGSGFKGCSTMTGITLPPSIYDIQYSAFEDCTSLTTFTCLGDITSVGDYAFDGCSSLANVSMPNGTASFGQSIFYNCSSLTTVTFPESISSLGPYSFYNCTSLINVSLPSGLTTLHNIFQHCPNLASVVLSETLETIDMNAFNDCNSLATLTIPAGVTYIDMVAIINCDHLTTITVNAVTPPIASSNIISYCPALTAILVPAGSVGAYQAAAGWSTYASLIMSQ
ncbi:MAG: InlB B-repeat-containing protein [Spirochaetales bacterium]|nr:InlB B-repeat-containing protein [Spirochaetales bacterium]